MYDETVGALILASSARAALPGKRSACWSRCHTGGMDTGVTVTGTGRASAPADRFRLMLGVTCAGPDVASAVARLGQRTEAVVAALRSHGVADEDMQTNGFSTHVDHDMMGAPSPSPRYRATHMIAVTSRDLDGFGELVDLCVSAADNDVTMDQIDSDLADPSELVAQASDTAFADARGKAEHLAALAGRALGSIESVSQTQPDFGMPFAGRKASRVPVALTPAEHTLEVAVTVRWSWA
jgi:uncharacterized protein